MLGLHLHEEQVFSETEENEKGHRQSCRQKCIGQLGANVFQVLATGCERGQHGRVGNGRTVIAEHTTAKHGGEQEGRRQSRRQGNGNGHRYEDAEGAPGGPGGEGNQASGDEYDRGDQLGRQGL